MSQTEERAWERAYKAGRKVFYEVYTGTLRQCPENYLLAIRRDGRFNPTPDKASPINGHSLGLVLNQHADMHGRPEELAAAVQRSFWGF